MKYVTTLFEYASYFPTIGFFLGLTWGFAKSSSNRSGGASGLAISVAIGGTIGLVVGLAVKFFAHYVTGAQSHPGLY